MSRQTKYERVEILGVDVDVLTINQAIDYVCEHAANHDQPAGYVVKPYVEFMDRAAGDPGLRTILRQSELALADGVALIWAAAFLYNGPRTWGRFWQTLGAIVLAPESLRQPLPERIAGINFTWPLLEAAATRGLSVFLIGRDSARDIQTTVETLEGQLPGLRIAGALSGRDVTRPPGEVGEAWVQDTLTTVQASGADLILVGMGFPLQERVMSRLAPHLDHGLLIGEGGTFDYEIFGGRRKKAPAAIQRLGLEWLWRLLLQPSRLRRQLAIPRFIWRIWRSRHVH